MAKIITLNGVADDAWTLLRLSEGETAETVALPEGDLIVPLAVWKARGAELAGRARLGLWLASHEGPEEIAADLPRFSVVAVDFPKFADGRGYSSAALLRTRYGYTGELRAIGDVLQDQLFYMKRVGFDAFQLRADKNIDAALKSLNDFSDAYQASTDQPLPLFRRRA